MQDTPKNQEIIRQAIYFAREEGDRVVVDGKTVWGGLGNRSGLHDYAQVAVNEKWEKSGARFEKKLRALPSGANVEIHSFRNITRDRGRWIQIKKFKPLD